VTEKQPWKVREENLRLDARCLELQARLREAERALQEIRAECFNMPVHSLERLNVIERIARVALAAGSQTGVETATGKTYPE
jgi:signal transduction histidine kinase